MAPISRIFLLTGAGVSAESGLSTFRDAGGIWTKHDFRDVATHAAFLRDPELVHGFYNARRANALKAEPNAAHRAIAALQEGLEARGGSLYVCTQNVDDLHERGGAEGVVHMHGELFKVRCESCGWRGDWREALGVETPCPGCGAAAGLRPDVVWFGEMPLHLDEIYEALDGVDLFAALGTSGSVYPAAGLVTQARRGGIRTLELNLAPSDNARDFDERMYGPATEIVPEWVEQILNGG
jgi:NAD-dependent deacetylase